jgi:hypothetical protein
MRPHAIYMMVLEATYNEEFLAERTEVTIKALLECVARDNIRVLQRDRKRRCCGFRAFTRILRVRVGYQNGMKNIIPM